MNSRHLTLIAIALLALIWWFLAPFTITLLNYIGLYAICGGCGHQDAKPRQHHEHYKAEHYQNGGAGTFGDHEGREHLVEVPAEDDDRLLAGVHFSHFL